MTLLHKIPIMREKQSLTAAIIDYCFRSRDLEYSVWRTELPKTNISLLTAEKVR